MYEYNINEIRKEYDEEGLSYRSLGKIYGVSYFAIRDHLISNKNLFSTKKKNNKIKLKEKFANIYGKDEDLIVVLKCRYCGKIHEIRDGRLNIYNCNCGKNLICWYVINYVYSKVLFRNKLMKNDSIRKFDKYAEIDDEN